MKYVLYLIMCITVCACTSRPTEEPTTEETGETQTSTMQTAATTQDVPAGWSRIWAEMAYYLERHSEQDEGYELVARYAEHGDSALASYVPAQPIRLFGIGRWEGMVRTGTGIAYDALQRMVIGHFDHDTLVSGIRIDTTGIYGGSLSRKAEGYGVMQHPGGAFYEGHWHRDQRSGYGFGISPTYLHAGYWRNDRFVGERMHYNSDRIYGIDVSRYQHERGRKRYGIDWKRLRITSLGHHISRQRVSGEVDYPVSFAYIKSTEGISIKNRYFLDDYTAARNQHIAVGAYHFFSTRQSAAAQATFFLQNSRFRSGDLPPMLDLEPTDAQIRAAGGPARLLQEVRTWLTRVEQRIGVRPIIYVNQNFVRKYLADAHDLKMNYQMWIARYGEYKPDVHLAFWQLSADGRVRGIQGEVDINVFNGYQNQWEEFLRFETIR